MSATIKEIVLKSVKTLLHNTIVVSTETIPYYTDYFGDSSVGIYLESYSAQDESTKHFYANMVTLEFSIFGKGKSTDFVAEATRRVMLALKASVRATITLNSGYQATYTQLPAVTSFTEYENGEAVHRDLLRVSIRVDEISN
jgi:hypothetical protein